MSSVAHPVQLRLHAAVEADVDEVGFREVLVRHLEEHEPKQLCDSTLVKETRTFAVKVLRSTEGQRTQNSFFVFLNSMNKELLFPLTCSAFQ